MWKKGSGTREMGLRLLVRAISFSAENCRAHPVFMNSLSLAYTLLSKLDSTKNGRSAAADGAMEDTICRIY